MSIIIFSWIYIFFLLYFSGYLFAKIIYIPGKQENIRWYEYVWVGFVFVISCLQIINIFYSIDWKILIFTTILALIGFIFFIVNEKSVLVNSIKRCRQHKFFYALASAFLLLLFFAYLASNSVSWYDTYLYHLNWVDWTNNAPIVPGLANLHSRLGFNSSFLTFASLFDNWIADGRSSHLVVSFFVSFIVFECIYLLKRYNVFSQKIFSALILPVILVSLLTSGQMASLSVDLISMIGLFALCLSFVDERKFSTITSLLLLFVAITIKQSSALFSIILIIYLLISKRSLLLNRNNIPIYILLSILIIGYLSRNIITSGWILYPLPLFNFNFDWAMPKSRIIQVYDITRAWGRFPGDNWANYLNVKLFEWIPVWYKSIVNSIENIIFISTLILWSILIVSSNIKKQLISNNLSTMIIIASSLIAVIFNIISSAQLRFVGIFVWIFFITTFSLLKATMKNWMLILIPILLFSFLLVKGNRVVIDHEIMFKSLRWEPKFETEPFSVIGTSFQGDDIILKKPKIIDWCGNFELLCTPELVNIKLRDQNNINKGFKYIEN